MRAHLRRERRTLTRILLAMAVLAVYFASHAALGSHGSLPPVGHDSPAAPHQMVITHGFDDLFDSCHGGDESPHASHPHCVAMPRTADGSSFDALASLIVAVAAACTTGNWRRRRPAGGPARSRCGREVLRSLCVLRN